MSESKVTARGQTTIPAEIRAAINAKPGTRLVWSQAPDGTLLVRAKTQSILNMAGALRGEKPGRLRLKDMAP